MKSLFLILLLFPANCYAQVCLVRIEEKEVVPKPNQSTKTVGSGFFVKDDVVATCYHVIEGCLGEDPPRIRIEYRDCNHLAKILDYSKKDDIALLEVNVENEKIYNLADKDPEPGDIITSKGYPRAKWSLHMNSGPLIELSTFLPNGPGDTETRSTRLVVKCMAIGGMSGGPLLNENDEVCGILNGRSNDGDPEFKTYGPFVKHLKELLEK